MFAARAWASGSGSCSSRERAPARTSAANGGDTGRKATFLADGDLLAGERGWSRSHLELLPQGRHEICAAPDRGDTGELSERQRTADAVCHKADVSLELGQRQMGAFAEDPIDAAGIEPEPAQPVLHLGDVVTVQHRDAAVQEPVAQVKAGLDEARPRLAVANAVIVKTALGLELLHRKRGPGAINARAVKAVLEAEPPEPFLQVGHWSAGIALTKWEEICLRRHGPCAAHCHEPCSRSIISHMVGDDGHCPVAPGLRVFARLSAVLLKERAQTPTGSGSCSSLPRCGLGPRRS